MSIWNPFKRKRLGDSDIDPIDVLIEPTGTESMTGHAEQHSALTQIQRDNVPKFEAVEKGVADNKNQIDGVYRNLQSFAEVINENKGRIADNEIEIANNTLAIAELDNRVDDIEEYLGAVEVEVSLGTGNFTYDSKVPPSTAHFANLGNAKFVEGSHEFWINNTDSRNNDLSQWDRARIGDKFNIFNSTQNKADYIIEYIKLDEVYAAWNIRADFVEGTGMLQYGTNYDLNITRVYSAFEPDSVGGIQGEHLVKKSGDAMTGPLIIDSIESKPFVVNGREDASITLYNTGLIAQSPPHENTGQNHMVNRKNLTDAINENDRKQQRKIEELTQIVNELKSRLDSREND